MSLQTLPPELSHQILDIVLLEANDVYPDGYKYKIFHKGAVWHTDPRKYLGVSHVEYDVVNLVPWVLGLRGVSRMYHTHYLLISFSCYDG